MTTKTRRPHNRSMSWMTHIGFASGILKITQDGKAEVYAVSPIDSDFGIGVRFEKFDAAEGDESYEVLVDGDRSTCSCKGHTYGGYCKHADAAMALHSRDLL